ncbi:MAG: SagB/ThcOx family dehydrogenase [Candidatus Nitronauta litoralis]|uniref:SagB/ThcOx family dehydrogenase n=1 Tax=Candidatus Nitronauta litoralis TaxID=2705533 RepID=A0A7T0BVS2_9BACT|nr:MAG: SagB/ThcOx family dehydrogenase [Candidatus Nitronauta litoralis]
MSDSEKVFNYHRFSKHGRQGFAPGPGYLDWASQPDPFRRYQGAELVSLEKVLPEERPYFSEALKPAPTSKSPWTFTSLSRFFFDCLALSAWKSFQGTRWALRVNPSSGNLHPTEGYLITGPLEGLSTVPGVFHYCPAMHALELRARLPDKIWETLRSGFDPQTFFIGLSSIYWREAWKYGLRAFRYCQHDLGHALGAVNMACAGLGWQAKLLDHLDTETLETLLGLTNKSETEVEVPDCLIAVSPKPLGVKPAWDTRLVRESFEENVKWIGTPNILSRSHVEWSGIDEVSEATEKPVTNNISSTPPAGEPSLFEEDTFPLRKAIHQRRSAVAMDGRTRISRDTFFQFLIKATPALCPLPFQTISWEPQVHLGLFVHRVDDLPQGLYVLVRNKNQLKELKSAFNPDFLWEKPEGCPQSLDLFLLQEGNFQHQAASVSCGQNIASDGCFSLGMISAFRQPLEQWGPWFYRRLYWECGAIGQILYLQAEVSGIRSTGIGCFLDDPVHQIFGIEDKSYQSLYHFTVGGPVEDTRLTTLPPY